jgi:hypothetical protein
MLHFAAIYALAELIAIGLSVCVVLQSSEVSYLNNLGYIFCWFIMRKDVLGDREQGCMVLKVVSWEEG